MTSLECFPKSVSKGLQSISAIKVSIVIPVFNKVEFTERCLNALFARTPFDIPWEVIVIDNASSDCTPELLQEVARQYSGLRWIRNDENLGFAGACNQGALNSLGEYILFLNNDTEAQENWLPPLVDILDRDFRVGAVGSKLLFPDGSIQHAGVVIVDRREIGDPLYAMHIHYKNFLDTEEVNKAQFYQAVTAACVLVRREAFEQVGGFDENYWNGYEDVDFCFKLQEKGWMIVYEPRSVVIHYESQSGPERFRRVRENITRLHQRWIGKITPDFVTFPGDVVKVVHPAVIKPYCLPFVSLIILTLNNLGYTQKCLESIYRYTPQDYEIIVVDNGSVDGTIEFLRNQPNVKLIQNDDNLGFALGNNRGLLEARGNYIVFLNNDVVVTEGWLTRLISCAESDPRVGIVGPRSNYVAGHQMVQNVPYGEDMKRMQEFAKEWSQNRMKQWEYTNRVIGFCMLVKREVVDKIGGFDPTFGLGNFEDDDFCIRAQIAGFRIKVAHDVFIHHFGSRTFQGEQIDYLELMYTNWEKFKAKWDLSQKLSLGEGYPIGMLIRRNFQEAKHQVPLQFAPYSLDGVHQVRYGACFSPQVLFWYIGRFQLHDNVTLVLYKEGNMDRVFQEISQMVRGIGFDPEDTPDILLFTEPLDEFGIAALLQAVDIVLITPDTPPSWRRWATYLGKKKEIIPSVS
ncbi:MAG: glycosyltransferase family 2 protein [Candidatus Caldatribacteriaceae bacterium]